MNGEKKRGRLSNESSAEGATEGGKVDSSVRLINGEFPTEIPTDPFRFYRDEGQLEVDSSDEMALRRKMQMKKW